MNGEVRVQPDRVIGRYAMYREIASGGMASVHFGRLVGPVGFGRTVAIKRLHPQYAKDPEFVGMFLDEARLASRVRHPNVVQTLDVVALEGELFVVMDYVQGESLSRLMKATSALRTRIPYRIVSSVMVGVLHGLHAAHEARDNRGRPLGLVHRDVSPHNVLVGTDGSARVLDFGVAFAKGRVQPSNEGQIKGKLSYMSPEQLNGDTVDRLTDVYAASVVLWELLTGQRLFDADNQGQILHRVLNGKVEPPSVLVPEIPAALEEIVMRGLARAPSERWATAKEMAAAIERSGAMATSSMVSGWVESVAGETLASRASDLALIEQSVADGDDLPPAEAVTQLLLRTPSGTLRLPTDTPPDGHTAVTLTGHSSTTMQLSTLALEVDGPTGPPPPTMPSKSRLRVALYLAVAASCAIGVIAGVFVGTGGGSDTVRSAAARSGPPVPVGEEARVAPSAAPSSSASSVARGIEVPTPRTSGSSTAVSHAPSAATPEASAHAAKKTPPPAPCDPPFTYDGAGHKKYKLECL